VLVCGLTACLIAIWPDLVVTRLELRAGELAVPVGERERPIAAAAVWYAPAVRELAALDSGGEPGAAGLYAA
jgi:hypothetical protein